MRSHGVLWEALGLGLLQIRQLDEGFVAAKKALTVARQDRGCGSGVSVVGAVWSMWVAGVAAGKGSWARDGRDGR